MLLSNSEILKARRRIKWTAYGPSDKVEHKVSGKIGSPFWDPIIDRNSNDICEFLRLRNQNPHRIIIGHLNINSIRNKFELLVRFAGNNLDILMVSITINRW